MLCPVLNYILTPNGHPHSRGNSLTSTAVGRKATIAPAQGKNLKAGTAQTTPTPQTTAKRLSRGPEGVSPPTCEFKVLFIVDSLWGFRGKTQFYAQKLSFDILRF